MTVEAAYLGDPVTLRADLGDGLPVEFYWWFTHEEKEKNMEGVKTACLPNSDCLSSTVVSRAEKITLLLMHMFFKIKSFQHLKLKFPLFN